MDQMAARLHDVTQARDDLDRKCRENEGMRAQMDRLQNVDLINRRLKDQKKDDDFQIQTLQDNLRDS